MARDQITLSQKVHLSLRAGGQTVATAESLTGGQLAVRFTETPGASETFLGGVVTYATALKQSLLDVDDQIVQEHGVVSAECARAMASGIKALTGASYGVSTTGVAGPSEQEGKAPGTVFVGVAGPGVVEAIALELPGDRGEVTSRTCDEALSALADILAREEEGLG
ncbi:nicotinamide-nucleotide amidohydrolase family protein [Nocardioides sp. dk4132]|uniref:CinA family protein n=1 Tax=unclassified Nocardioides TaxID=2615069 RepID=UPI0012955539|nr:MULTISPECIES: CinA family protein [unclassified Nocardioides]MQW77259.1 nicotinamide-nucleotide amidohydrolase family protein [Nocardioides sp. dk4132]QGA08015.1 nicotinamide-nucleotide amidohydrolase family protein [Nocardioides sp. dk884]